MLTSQTFLSQTPTQMPNEISELEEQMAQIDQWKKIFSDAIRELMQIEMEEKKYFPQEIHEFTQKRNMLETYREMRRIRIAKINML